MNNNKNEQGGNTSIPAKAVQFVRWLLYTPNLYKLTGQFEEKEWTINGVKYSTEEMWHLFDALNPNEPAQFPTSIPVWVKAEDFIRDCLNEKNPSVTEILAGLKLIFQPTQSPTRPSEEDIEAMAERILDEHYPHSYYYPDGNRKMKQIHDNQCRRCDVNDELIKAMVEMFKQALTTVYEENIRKES
jgi:hypothetical protein